MIPGDLEDMKDLKRMSSVVFSCTNWALILLQGSDLGLSASGPSCSNKIEYHV